MHSLIDNLFSSLLPHPPFQRAIEAGTALSEEEEINAYLLSVPQQELTLTIDVFDWNAVAKGVFLGSADLRGADLDELCRCVSVLYVLAFLGICMCVYAYACIGFMPPLRLI